VKGGALRHVIELAPASWTSDASGGPTVCYGTATRYREQVLEKSAREYEMFDAPREEVDAVFKVREIPGGVPADSRLTLVSVSPAVVYDVSGYIGQTGGHAREGLIAAKRRR
jgi:hypothetical protein